jgi:hypothetical protein
MTRVSFILFFGIISIVGISTVTLAGCGSSSGTISPAAGSAQTQSAASPPTASGTTTPAGDGGNGDNSSGSGTPAGDGGTGGWVLSAPKSIFGFAQIQPSAAMLTKIQSELVKGAAPLGVSGSQIVAVYDDPTHDVYLIFAGYNGSGFDPGKMKPVFNVPPAYTTDGAGDHLVENHALIDAGAHGGLAGCGSSMIQSGSLAAESTDCAWMTPTTMGSITYYPKPDQKQMVFGTGPDVMGKVMRDLRDQVEHRS